MKSFVCWISPHSKENWEICKSYNQWGIGKDSNVANSHAQKISRGDLLFIWVGDIGYVGMAEVDIHRPLEVNEKNKAPWEDGPYSFTIPWQMIKELERPVYLKFDKQTRFQEKTKIKQGVTNGGFFQIDEEQTKALLEIFE